MTFEQAVPLIKDDVRFNALRSIGEKKQCFNEYKVVRAKEEKVCVHKMFICGTFCQQHICDKGNSIFELDLLICIALLRPAVYYPFSVSIFFFRRKQDYVCERRGSRLNNTYHPCRIWKPICGGSMCMHVLGVCLLTLYRLLSHVFYV